MADEPMDDLNPLSWQCEHCGAAVGEPCADDCPYAEANANDPSFEIEADEAQALSSPQTLTEQAQGIIHANSYRLPFSGLLSDPPDPRGDDDDQWLGKFALWFVEYQKLIRTEVDKLSADSRKAIALQFEKDVVRGFLIGTPTPQEAA